METAELELEEGLTAVFGKPTELAPGITAFGQSDDTVADSEIDDNDDLEDDDEDDEDDDSESE